MSSLFAGDAVLDNADGFTTLYNLSTAGNGSQGYEKGKMVPDSWKPTSLINGYKTYYSNGNRHYFSAGDTLKATFNIVKPSNMSSSIFAYAVDASWAKPTEPVVVPDSFPLTANSLEAYKIDAQLSNSLALTAGSIATLTIDVYDWQGASTLSSVEIEGPYFWDGLKKATVTSGGPGTQRYTCDISNDKGFVDVGSYPIVIRVLDTQSNPGALVDNIAWKVLPVPVIINHPPVCSANFDPQEPDPGQPVTFTDTSTDPDGGSDIKQSWWDWDNDGVWDEQGFTVQHTWNDPGVYTVNHKVVDSAGAVAVLSKPLTLDVGLFITLQEDMDHKVIGTKYNFISKTAPYASGSIIDVYNPTGPWDFTTIGLTDLTNSVTMLSPTDPEVASFVNDFSSNTTLFVKSSNIYSPFLPDLYEAEGPYFDGNLLYVYGFYGQVIGASPFGPPTTTNPLAIPYPLSIDTDYTFDINNPGFVLTYQVKAIGKGDVKVPYLGGTTYHCLVLRYKFNVSSTGLNGGTLNFAFVDDSGLIVANVVAVNYGTDYNFVPSSNEITGTALFQALNSIG